LEIELSAHSSANTSPISSLRQNRARGMVNQLDIASGRTLLHIASLHGSDACVRLLLGAGALVHLRDVLDHRPLYYAARQKHRSIVEEVRNAGAHLNGADIEGGYAELAYNLAQKSGDHNAIRIWLQAGFSPATTD